MSAPSLAACRVALDARTGIGTAPGTFGELLQGALPAGTDFLVTFPITLRSRASFRFDPNGPLRVFPSHKTKSLRLARALLEAHGAKGGGTLVIASELLVGKGLASSSADLVATARAVGSVLGADCSPAAIEAWLRPIEPTDGVMHPGIVAFEHRAVRLRAALGTLPPTTVVAVDEGGLIDTVEFNRRGKHFSATETAQYEALLDTLSLAVAAGDLRTVGAVATRSAELNQRFAPKHNLAAMIATARRVGALGVVCAHSGTMLGLLLDAAEPGYPARFDAALDACRALPGATSAFAAQPITDTEHAHAI